MKKTAMITSLLTLLFGASTWVGESYANEPESATETEQAVETATVELTVSNMTCATCPFTVRKSLERVEGTIDVQVDYATKLAKVTYDPRLTNVATLTQATTNAGYPSKAVK